MSDLPRGYALHSRMALRPEEPADVAAVADLTDAAFTSLPPGIPGHGQEAPTVERRLLEELREDGDLLPTLTLVAVVDDAVVGHVACSRATLAGRPSIGLGPISVRPDLQGRGIGAALLTAVSVTAEEAGEPAILLLGDPGYYGFFGWLPAASLGITAPGPWGDAFQVKPLRSWRDDLAGPFVYAPAFGRLDG